MQLLLAEDDKVLADALAAQLAKAGFEVKHAPNGPVAEYLLTNQHFDVAILDLGLPMVDGLTVLKQVRSVHPDLPVIILTALDKSDSRVTGLMAGADDYVTKPFDFPELRARLHAVMRRSKQAVTSTLSAGALRYDRGTQRAVMHGELVDLPSREAILLELLMTNIGKVVTKEEITSAWASEGNEVGGGNAAEVYIFRLRRKLENSGLLIRTVRGLGYLLQAEPPGFQRT
jgi:two-component system OmpR family response regulator